MALEYEEKESFVGRNVNPGVIGFPEFIEMKQVCGRVMHRMKDSKGKD
jgi:hypothetical protein